MRLASDNALNAHDLYQMASGAAGDAKPLTVQLGSRREDYFWAA